MIIQNKTILTITFLATILIFATNFIPAHAQSYDIVITPSDHSSIISVLDLPEDYVIDVSGKDDFFLTAYIDDTTVQVYGLDNNIDHLVELRIYDDVGDEVHFEELLISSIPDPGKDSTTATISGIGNLTLPNVMEYDNGVTLTGSNDFTFSGDFFVGIDGNGIDLINDGESITYDFQNSTDYVLFSYSVTSNTDLDEPTTILFEGYSNEDKIIDVIGATMPDSNMHIITNVTVPLTSLTITVVHDGIGYPSLFADIYNSSPYYCGEHESYYNIIHGTNSSDYIFGTINPDLIFGYEGNDMIMSINTNNCIYAGDGNDFVYAIRNNNTVYGGSGDDSIYIRTDGSAYGEDGNDMILLGGNLTSNYTVDGGDGTSDVCIADRRNATITTENCEIIQ